MTGRTVRRAAVLGLGAVWWWAVLRLALTPHAGVLEGAVALGGWSVSLLPVHCVPKARATGVSGTRRRAQRRTRARAAAEEPVPVPSTSASPYPRSDEESGPW